jgi:hypothetical protein
MVGVALFNIWSLLEVQQVRVRQELMQIDAVGQDSNSKRNQNPGPRKTKSAVRYLTRNLTKPLCQPSDSSAFSFLDLRDFRSVCVSYGDVLVAVGFYTVLHSLSVTD